MPHYFIFNNLKTETRDGVIYNLKRVYKNSVLWKGEKTMNRAIKHIV
jgi:hypothetical protein